MRDRNRENELKEGANDSKLKVVWLTKKKLWELNEKAKTADESTNTTSKNVLGTLDVQIDFIANLKRHTRAVNIVRWSHDGKILASAGDEPVVFLWTENDIKNQKTLDNEEFENKENWFVFKTLR